MTLKVKKTNILFLIRLAENALSPLGIALPLIIIFENPLVQEVFLINVSNFVKLSILLLSYMVFFLIEKKTIFNKLSISVISALIVSGVLSFISNGTCIEPCIGMLNDYFGLACGYSKDGCFIENNIIAFLIIFFCISLNINKLIAK